MYIGRKIESWTPLCLSAPGEGFIIQSTTSSWDGTCHGNKNELTLILCLLSPRHLPEAFASINLIF